MKNQPVELLKDARAYIGLIATHLPECRDFGHKNWHSDDCDCYDKRLVAFVWQAAMEQKEPDGGGLALWPALDRLYSRGYQDRSGGQDHDPRKASEWQHVLDLSRLRVEALQTENERLKTRVSDTGFIRAFWRRIFVYRNDFEKELPQEMPVQFAAAFETAAILLRKPSDRGGKGYEREVLGQNNEGDTL